MKLKLVRSKQKQKTIKKKFKFEGFSLFSGKNISMICEPGEVNTGIVFCYQEVCIPALAENVKLVDVHTTALSKRGVNILTIEHLMAAVWGLGIDNLKITLDSGVVPAQDGSAEAYVKAFLKVGVVDQKDTRQVVEFDELATVTQPEFENRVAKFEPNNKLLIECSVPFADPIGKHTVVYLDNAKSFEKEVSWARTFLRSPIDLKNLTKWNGIRSVFKALPADPRKSPIITFTKEGFLTPLKKKNEPARHKLLDLIGDLALIGYRVNAKLFVNEPGHKFTHLIAQEVRNSITANINGTQKKVS